MFKNRLDQYVPGFASLSDSAADTYVALVDSVGLGRKRGDHEREKVGLGLEKKDVHLGSVIGERRKGKVKEKVPTSPPVEKVSGKTEQQVVPPEREETAPAPAHGGTTDTVADKEGKEEGREKEAQEQVEEIPAQPSPVVPSPSPPPPSSPSLTAEGEQAEEEKASQVVVKEEAAEQKEEAGKEEKEEERAEEEVKVEEVEAQCMYLMCLLHRDGSACNSLNVLLVCALH